MLNGQILPGDVDRYRFEARQGQHLVVDVSARKLIPYLSDERGLKGNLIVNVFAEKTGDDSGKGKEQRKKRRILWALAGDPI